MAKVQVIDSLRTSATRCFARHGYDGTSLRDIAADAGVPLSSIHTYFGSKLELYEDVCRRAWIEIAEERNALILKGAAAASDGNPTMRDIAWALAYPVVRRTLGGDEFERDVARIVRDDTSYQVVRGATVNRSDKDEPRVFWLKCISRVYPEFSWPALVWLYSFIIGTIYSWQITDSLYDDLRQMNLGANAEKSGNTVETVTSGLVHFCVGGVDELYRQKFKAPQSGATPPVASS